MTKTIWHISKYVVPNYASRVGSRGFQILREMAAKGHKCVHFCSDSNHLANPPSFNGPVLYETVDGVDVYWVKTRKYKGANSFGRILSWFSFEWRFWHIPKAAIAPPDVIIVSSLSLLTIFNGMWLRRKYGSKLVFEIRDIWPLSLQELRDWSRWNPVVLSLGWIEKKGYRSSDLIVGTMPNLGDHVSDVLGYSRPVACVPQGMDAKLLEQPDPLDPEFEKAYLPSGKFTIVYAGTIGIANALEPFFETARRMQDEKDLHFLVLGDGYLKPGYQAEYGSQSNITFAPAVPKSMVQSVLSKCDLMFFSTPSSPLLRYGQSLNKIIDYMASGKPVLASYSGFPSMINEAGCGSFVPAGDVDAICAEIGRYYKMPRPERERMGHNGRAWLLDNRSFSALADHYLELIDAIPSK